MDCVRNASQVFDRHLARSRGYFHGNKISWQRHKTLEKASLKVPQGCLPPFLFDFAFSLPPYSILGNKKGRPGFILFFTRGHIEGISTLRPTICKWWTGLPSWGSLRRTLEQASYPRCAYIEHHFPTQMKEYIPFPRDIRFPVCLMWE